jgi:hypothetical protein
MALSLFARITSVLFNLPIALAFCYHIDTQRPRTHHTILHRLMRVFTHAVWVLLGVVFVSAACILMDSLYFGHLHILFQQKPISLYDLPILVTSPHLWQNISIQASNMML